MVELNEELIALIRSKSKVDAPQAVIKKIITAWEEVREIKSIKNNLSHHTDTCKEDSDYLIKLIENGEI